MDKDWIIVLILGLALFCLQRAKTQLTDQIEELRQWRQAWSRQRIKELQSDKRVCEIWQLVIIVAVIFVINWLGSK